MSGAASLIGGGLGAFLGMAVLFGAAAMLSGQAFARNWRPARQLVLASLLLALGDRFLLFALFGGRLLSVGGFILAFILFLAAAGLAYRLTQVTRMVTQYPWLYARRGLFAWRDREARKE